ncbi:MAG: glycosyltransferase [Spartobacteria bacterium]|nr:glycosyltransferase [Spartobacteria bacterium]
MRGISIVVPCLNEASSLAEVVAWAQEGIRRTGLDGEVIVVDNGSTDGSPEIAEKAGARVLHEKMRGYGSAIRRGFRDAKYDILVMGDADLTYDFREVDKMALPLDRKEADMVIGNRMKNIQPGSMPWLHQHIGNPLLSLMVRVMFHNNSVRDTHCGMRAIRREAYDRLRCATTGMEFASEMVIRAFHHHLKIIEIDIIYHARIGESKLRSFRDGWRHLRFMMLHSPSTMLLIPGAFLWIAGFLMTIPLVFGPIMLGHRVIDVHFMIVGGILNIVGVQILTMGLLAKAYAHLSGLRIDPLIAWFYKHMTFEKAALVSGFLILCGALLAGGVILHWVAQGMGALDASRALLFGLICLANGVQIGAASYLFSIMALPRRLDGVVPEVANTEIDNV